jgi:alkylation response protein AidB-like acyl-CoA dehydrogenase
VATGITDEHQALHATAARWADTRCSPAVARAALDADTESLPPFWAELADLGWLTLHRDYGMAEAAIVVEELGRAAAPGPLVPTLLATALVADLDPLRPAAVGLAPGAPVVGATVAESFVLPVDGGWRLFERDEVDVAPAPSIDPTRRVAVVTPARAGAGTPLAIEDARVAALAAVLYTAEGVGLASWCVETAAAYAKVREQFGRPIGQFQAVKHRCADMVVALELSRAAAWDAARAADDDDDEARLAAAVAAALVPEAAWQCAKDCIQVLGGIGFTWEHDAHLYLKRALAVRQSLGPAAGRDGAVARLALAGARRRLDVDLPPDAERHRAEASAAVDAIAALGPVEQRTALADGGWLVPHWPAPWGRDAGPEEQLVIDEELRRARVRRPHLQVGGWVLPTLIVHGTPAQQERFIGPSLRGELAWCQLFSEPGAGSDLAGLATKAARADGGWLLTGQKVWTSMAREAQWGICLARTNPDVPKHDGITCFLVDMASDGIDIRPLRELTGMTMFNEVFLNDVFVPDDCVIGPVDAGWAVSRTTLANERVSMGAGSSMGPGVRSVLDVVRDEGLEGDPAVMASVGELLAESHGLAVMGLRATLRSLAGADPGPESSVRKLLGVEHDQRVQEAGLELLGPSALTGDGPAAAWLTGLLFSRSLTIAGGTSEIQRNVIAERLLGLPKDP